MSVLEGSKVFLLTNSDTYTMPKMINWTSSEAITFANLVHLSYNIDGYGKVNKTSINVGEELTNDMVLEIVLGGTVNEERENGDEESKEN